MFCIFYEVCVDEIDGCCEYYVECGCYVVVGVGDELCDQEWCEFVEDCYCEVVCNG